MLSAELLAAIEPFPHWVSECRTQCLVNGDCLEVLPRLPAGCVDAVVTDPPYGMNGTTANMNRGNASCRWALPTAKSAWPANGNRWDDEAPAIVTQLPAMAAGDCIIWGGQFFSLPLNRCWLVWNKIIRNFQSSVCELAWTNLNAPVDAFDYSHGQLANEGKVHPTQKPLPLIIWCVKKTAGRTVLDPFAGSFTTLVACVRTGRCGLGIEIDPGYYAIGVKRVQDELGRHPLFREQERLEQKELSL